MRKKKHKEHVNHERWLVSYADFITLLFAFFVVLYSSSQVDQRKVGKLQLAITAAFQELGLFPVSTSNIPLNDTEPLPFADAQMFENIERSTAYGKIVPNTQGTPGISGAGAASAELKRKLESALAPEILRKQVEVVQRPDGVVLSLREMGFYEPGSSTLRPEAYSALKRITDILRTHQFDVRVEGHTDNTPISNSKFASNWELSTSRATDLVHAFITEFNFPPENLSAAGYAEFHPVASNDTVEGRTKNRRVDLIILATHAEAPEPDDDPLDEPTGTPPAPVKSASAKAPEAKGTTTEKPDPKAKPHAGAVEKSLTPIKAEPPIPKVVSQLH